MEDDELLTSESTQEAISRECPVWGCGSNSPEIDLQGFHVLSELGQANAQGFRIAWFRKYWMGAHRYYRPDVDGGALIARNLGTGAAIHTGTALAGAEFRITRDGTSSSYLLQVKSVSSNKMWADPNGSRSTPTYELRWVDESDIVTGTHIPWVNLCSAAPPGDEDGMLPFHAVLFEDDRIDADELQVVGHTPDTFNIGCAGHALAKQHLTGHTRAGGEILGVYASLAQRTANLKMITGDYCGNGTPLTVAGTELHWRDRYAWFNSIRATDPVEARWTEAGATCLSKPRVDYSPSALSVEHFGSSVEDEILKACDLRRPPACTSSTSDMQGAYVLSANY